MSRTGQRTFRVLAALLLGVSAMLANSADFKLTDANGRQILLKDDGTWRYVDSAEAGATKNVVDGQPQAELQLLRRREIFDGCSFDLSLENRLPYDIGSLVPQFLIVRGNGIVFLDQMVDFGRIRPHDQVQRELKVMGLKCSDIVKLQVTGGDRCEMGDLDKFTDGKGHCLARVRVKPSTLVPFSK